MPPCRPPIWGRMWMLEVKDIHAAYGRVKVLHGVSLIGECSARTWARIVSFGERASAGLVAAAFRARGRPAEACDARTLIRTDDTFGNAWVDTPTTYRQILEHRLRRKIARLQRARSRQLIEKLRKARNRNIVDPSNTERLYRDDGFRRD